MKFTAVRTLQSSLVKYRNAFVSNFMISRLTFKFSSINSPSPWNCENSIVVQIVDLSISNLKEYPLMRESCNRGYTPHLGGLPNRDELRRREDALPHETSSNLHRHPRASLSTFRNLFLIFPTSLPSIAEVIGAPVA